MMIDPAAIGTELPPSTMLVERGRLRLFAEATGQRDPIYFDIAAAAAAGHPDLPAPPTFLCALHHERAEPFDWLNELGVALDRVLHGEQEFTYHQLVYADDYLTARSRISDIYAKKNGTLQFIVRHTAVTRNDEPVADLRDVVVVRNEETPR
ncbi:MaoC family dehydratase N-terminal domain-containing protein [Nocardia donostiensis]|nr:MaoC family dehydratase N-terminal domain-containing protein [Nocardia donostiensis]